MLTTSLKNALSAVYKNNSYPFLLAVHRYGHEANQAYRFDVASFELPGAGDEREDYIVFYNWQSYYDVVDVDYLGDRPAVTNVYGVLNTTQSWEKIGASQTIGWLCCCCSSAA